jgi:hypothetical protein
MMRRHRTECHPVVAVAQGLAIGPYDLLINGHALARGLILVTNNTSEFRRVAWLSLEDWQTPGSFTAGSPQHEHGWTRSAVALKREAQSTIMEAADRQPRPYCGLRRSFDI